MTGIPRRDPARTREKPSAHTGAPVGAADFPQSRRPEAEFFSLVYELDPQAANDDYYATSADFLLLQSQLRAKLIQGFLLWFVGISVAFSAAAIFYG